MFGIFSAADVYNLVSIAPKKEVFKIRKISAAMSLAAAVLWGMVGVPSRELCAAGLAAADLTLLRCSAVFVLSLAVCVVTDPASLRPHLIFLLAGVGSVAFFNVCYFITQQLMPLAISGVFLYTAPFFVCLISALLFGERLTVRKLAALAAALGGCVLCCGVGGVGITPLSAAVGLCSGFGYALYSILAKLSLEKYPPQSFLLYTFFFAALAMLPFADIAAIAHAARSGAALHILLFSLVFTALPYALYTLSLKWLEASAASILAYAEPFTAAAVGVVFFGEELSAAMAVGMVMIFTALVCICKGKKNPRNPRR